STTGSAESTSSSTGSAASTSSSRPLSAGFYMGAGLLRSGGYRDLDLRRTVATPYDILHRPATAPQTPRQSSRRLAGAGLACSPCVLVDVTYPRRPGSSPGRPS